MKVLLRCCALFLLAGSTHATDFYVSILGDDAGKGTLEDPFRSIARAAKAMKPGDVSFVRGGNYHEHIVLNGKKGSARKPFVFSAYQDEEVTLDGSVPIESEWEKYQGNIYRTRLKQPVWQLFVNGQSMASARWPNGNWDDGSIWDKTRSMMWPQGGELGHYTNEQLQELDFSLANGGILIVNSGSFRTYKSFITEHEPGSDNFRFDTSTVKVHFSTEERVEKHGYFIEGKKELIDTENEWFYEPKTETLYLWAQGGADPTGLDVRGKRQSYAFEGKNCGHIRIRGFNFFGTTVSFRNCTNITIEDSHFRYPSYSKRMLRDIGPMDVTRLVVKDEDAPAHHVIRNNIFEYMDGPAMELNGAGNMVENNDIHHVDYSCTYSGGFTLNMIDATELVFRRNTIHTTGTSETFKAGKRNIVELNDISRTGFLQNDGSTIQISVKSQDRSFTRYNWVHDTVKQGLRFDNSNRPNSPWGENGTLHHNVVWKTDRIFFKGDKHFIFNNLVFDSDKNDLIISANKAIAGFNYETITRNNIANNFSGHRTLPGSEHPVPGIVDHNWAGNFEGADIRTQLRDPDNLDFRPMSGSELIDAGIPVAGKPVPFIGEAPDIGPYEYGNPVYWIPGHQQAQASKPVPPDGTVTAMPDADLMWLGAYKASTHHVYLGRNREAVAAAAPDSPEYRQVFEGERNIFEPGDLQPGGTYYWRVDAVRDGETVKGQIWAFTIRQ